MWIGKSSSIGCGEGSWNLRSRFSRLGSNNTKKGIISMKMQPPTRRAGNYVYQTHSPALELGVDGLPNRIGSRIAGTFFGTKKSNVKRMHRSGDHATTACNIVLLSWSFPSNSVPKIGNLSSLWSLWKLSEDGHISYPWTCWAYNLSMDLLDGHITCPWLLSSDGHKTCPWLLSSDGQITCP